MIEHARLVIPVQVGEAAEINYGGPAAPRARSFRLLWLLSCSPWIENF